MQYDVMRTAKKIKKLRKVFGLTQAELSEDLNTSIELIKALEQGRRKLTIEHLIMYSDYFHVSLYYLIFDDDYFNKDIRKYIEIIKENLVNIEINL